MTTPQPPVRTARTRPSRRHRARATRSLAPPPSSAWAACRRPRRRRPPARQPSRRPARPTRASPSSEASSPSAASRRPRAPRRTGRPASSRARRRCRTWTSPGEQVTVTSGGLVAAGQSTGSSLPISSINTLLGELGISLSMTNATDSVNGPSASRTLDGLKITIDLKTLDAAANTFATLLPASLTSQLPVALPNDQQLTLDLATVQVSSTASPSFAAGNSGNTGAGSNSSAGATPVGRHLRRHRQLRRRWLHRHHGHRRHLLGRHLGRQHTERVATGGAGGPTTPVRTRLGHRAGLQGDRRGARAPGAARRLGPRLRLQARRRGRRAARHLVRRRRPADGALHRHARRPHRHSEERPDEAEPDGTIVPGARPARPPQWDAGPGGRRRPTTCRRRPSPSSSPRRRCRTACSAWPPSSTGPAPAATAATCASGWRRSACR